MKQLIISGFPGTGKSWCVNKWEGNDYMPQKFAIDSDSSKFYKPDFPSNYISHIKEKISEGYNKIFISSHKEVREALVAEGLSFTLVYPEISLKEEYLIRYKERGNSSSFIEMMDNNWNRFIEECQDQEGCNHIVIPSMIFISDIVWDK